jgi:hypothetical protein
MWASTPPHGKYHWAVEFLVSNRLQSIHARQHRTLSALRRGFEFAEFRLLSLQKELE